MNFRLLLHAFLPQVLDLGKDSNIYFKVVRVCSARRCFEGIRKDEQKNIHDYVYLLAVSSSLKLSIDGHGLTHHCNMKSTTTFAFCVWRG